MKVTPKYCMSVINLIEEHPRVDNYFRYAGLDIWPIVRIQLMYQLTHGFERTARKHEKVLLLARVNTILKSIFSILFKKWGDSIFFSDEKFTYLNEKILSNPSLLGSQSAFTYISFSGGFSSSGNVPKASLEFVSAVSHVCVRLFSWLNLGGPVRRYVSNILVLLDQIDPDVLNLLDQKKLQVIIARTVMRAVFIYPIIRVLLAMKRPKNCFIVCYYSPFGLALCAACKNGGVNITEIQHGVAGRYMRAYGRWEGLNGLAYNTLPERFLSWTKVDHSAISEWANVGAKNVSSDLIGLDWLYTRPETCDEIVMSHLKVNLSFRKTVIVTCGSGNSLMELMFDYVEAFSDCMFLFRGHPDEAFSQHTFYKNKFSSNNASFLFPEEVSLSRSLIGADLHVSEWSAVTYAAIHFDIHTLIMTEAGRDYFEGQPLVHYFKDSSLSDFLL